MFKVLFTLVISVLVSSAGFVYAQRYGQRVDIAVNAGYATFNQRSLKDLQQEILSQMPPQGKITNSFPGYLNYTVDAVFIDSTYFVGILLGHTSTGGRIQYTDYSGSVTADQIVKMNYNGVVAAKRIASTKYGNIFLGANILAYRNKVNLSYSETIYDEHNKSTMQLKSLNIGLGGFVQIYKRMGRFFLKGYGGYEAHFATDLYYDTPENTYKTSSGETVKVNADGVRLGLGVGYTVYKREAK